jgi:hypothetical protein
MSCRCAVLVLDWEMLVLVPLGQMQPETGRHEAACREQLRGQRLVV